jgi:hypothetical protein
VLTPDTDDQVVPELVLDSQRYVIVAPDVVVVPEVVLVKAAGSPPLQIVWSDPIAPAVGTACTVTVTAAVAADSHATEFSVDMVILRYCVVAVKPEGTS